MPTARWIYREREREREREGWDEMKHKQVDDVGVTNNPQHKRWAGDASTSRVGKETKQAVGAILRSSGLLLLTGEEGRRWYAAPLGDNLVL